MNELQNSIYNELYRPKVFDDLIFKEKESLLNYLKEALSLPSFIFYSSPGTGKTSCTKIIIEELDCDTLILNGSKENGVDIVREKVEVFVSSLSSNPKVKRLVFYEEGEKITSEAQKALKDIIEKYSDNSFFVFTTNDVSKIDVAIQSRCVLYSFENPNKDEIYKRLEHICNQESIIFEEPEILQLVEQHYPDVRSMIKNIQLAKIGDKPIDVHSNQFVEFYQSLKNKDIDTMRGIIYSETFNIQAFNRWFFRDLFMNCKNEELDKTGQIAILLADIEKSHKISVCLEIVAVANYLKIMKIL